MEETGDRTIGMELTTLMLDYDNLIKDFPQTIKGAQQDPSQVPKAEKLAEQMKQALSNIIDTAGNPPDRDEDLIDTKLDGDLIMASMKSRGGGKWNAKDLLTAAQELSDCLNDMIDKNRQKQDLLENWDDILGMIDNASGRDGKKQKKVEDLLDQIYQQEIEKKRKKKRKKERDKKKKTEKEKKRRKEEEKRKKKTKRNKFLITTITLLLQRVTWILILWEVNSIILQVISNLLLRKNLPVKISQMSLLSRELFKSQKTWQN